MGRRDRLADISLSRLFPGVEAPRYDRRSVLPGIVHLGVGAFHRAHQAVYLDDYLGAGETDWGIIGASLRSAETRDRLAPQDCLYTVAAQEPGAEQLRVVGSLLKLLVAPEDPAALVAAMVDPAIRIVTMTVSEKAYLRNAAGDLDLSHSDVVADLAHPARPKTLHGLIAAALERRRAAGAPPFTVLCCDNLPTNGEVLRRLLIQFTAARDEQLARYIEREVAFPSTMVDRIVPATTAEDRERISAAIGLDDAWPVKAEPFMQWVVEEKFSLGRPDWEKHGVTMVADVRPFEEMKLRLLNGAHSGIAYLGLLSGFDTVFSAFADPAIRGFVDRLWAEAIPTLAKDAALDTPPYTAALATRFANAALVHRTAQIATDGSQKLPQRILASAQAQLAAGRPAAHLALVISAWVACCEARGSQFPVRHFTDPLDAQLGRIFAAGATAEETVRQIFQRAGFGVTMEEYAEPLAATVAGQLGTLREKGASAAIAAAAGMGSPA